MESSHNKTTMIVIAGIVGALVGGLLVWSMTSMIDKAMSKTKDPQMTMSAESDGITVGGAKTVQSKDIVDNAVNASQSYDAFN